jgi:DNA modification methylase
VHFRGAITIDNATLETTERRHQYFSEIKSFTTNGDADDIFRIADIITVEADNRRGQKPFPHPFPARMPIEVAKAAVRALTKRGDLVLDPMAGSGAVAKAAIMSGRRAVAVDIDPLAVIQARALCAKPLLPRFDAIAGRLIDRARKLKSDPAFLRTQWKSLDEEGTKFIRYWFPKTCADQLFALSVALDDVADQRSWPVFATILSSLIISRGSGASMAMDLSRSRPHRVDSKVPRRPFEAWERQVNLFRKYYEAFAPMSQANVRVGDARKLTLGDGSVDAIVTSPPYLNAIDYFRTSKFSLIFLGSRLSELRSTRATAIGSEVGLPAGQLPAPLEALVDNGVLDTRRRPMVRRYIFDLNVALAESYRVLKPGCRALYVMGPSILSRRDYDAAPVLIEVAKLVGFTPLSHGRRDIDEARRSLPPPRRSGRAQSINKRMTCEYYIALAKAHS